MTEIDWLAEFMENVERQAGTSCSCSKDCDRERDAAYAEIQRLRGESGFNINGLCCECGDTWPLGMSGSSSCLQHPGRWRHFPNCPNA